MPPLRPATLRDDPARRAPRLAPLFRLLFAIRLFSRARPSARPCPRECCSRRVVPASEPSGEPSTIPEPGTPWLAGDDLARARKGRAPGARARESRRWVPRPGAPAPALQARRLAGNGGSHSAIGSARERRERCFTLGRFAKTGRVNDRAAKMRSGRGWHPRGESSAGACCSLELPSAGARRRSPASSRARARGCRRRTSEPLPSAARRVGIRSFRQFGIPQRLRTLRS